MHRSIFTLALPLAALMFTAACTTSPRERLAGTLLDPYCMPDGSPLLVQYANTQGSFTGTKGRRENCLWFEPSSHVQTAATE